MTAGRSRQLRSWALLLDADPAASCTMSHVWKAHKMTVTDLAYDPTGTLVASESADASAMVFDVDRTACTHVFRGHEGPVHLTAFHPDRRNCGCSRRRDNVRWDLAARACVGSLRDARRVARRRVRRRRRHAPPQRRARPARWASGGGATSPWRARSRCSRLERHVGPRRGGRRRRAAALRDGRRGRAAPSWDARTGTLPPRSSPTPHSPGARAPDAVAAARARCRRTRQTSRLVLHDARDPATDLASRQTTARSPTLACIVAPSGRCPRTPRLLAMLAAKVRGRDERRAAALFDTALERPAFGHTDVAWRSRERTRPRQRSRPRPRTARCATRRTSDGACVGSSHVERAAAVGRAAVPMDPHRHARTRRPRKTGRSAALGGAGGSPAGALAGEPDNAARPLPPPHRRRKRGAPLRRRAPPPRARAQLRLLRHTKKIARAPSRRASSRASASQERHGALCALREGALAGGSRAKAAPRRRREDVAFSASPRVRAVLGLDSQGAADGHAALMRTLAAAAPAPARRGERGLHLLT